MFGKNKKEKPISYYARYLGGHLRYPSEENIGVYIHAEQLELAFQGHSIIIPYSDIKNITNLDKGKVFNGANIAAFGIFGLLMKRKVNAMIIEYNDYSESNTQTIALDFWSNVKYAQPIIYDRMVNAKATSTATPTTLSQESTTIRKEHLGGPFN